jgi:hypothetical protein
MPRHPKIARDRKAVLVRFVLPSTNPDTGVQEGIFNAAYALRREGEMARRDREELDTLLRWFGDNLAVPTRFNKTKSKGYFRRNTKGISWLKPSATEHVSRMHLVAGILKKHGRPVTMLKTLRPGYVVYEDEYQVVAEPFADLHG